LHSVLSFAQGWLDQEYSRRGDAPMKNDLGHPVCIGNRRRFVAIDGEHVFVTVEDEIVRPQGPKPHTKLIYLQKLKFEKTCTLNTASPIT
jgi:hypothetical protein